jgi:uncharacterized protein (TIGR02246 family)
VFERYTERARRAVFFARYEACQTGSPTIESEHLLLGVLREDPALFFEADASFRSQDLKNKVSAHLKLKPAISTSVDIPLSPDCKRAIAQAAQESQRLGSRTVGCEHILMALLRQDESNAARAMKQTGITLSTVRRVSAKPDAAAGSATGDAMIAAVGRVFKLIELLWNDQNLEAFANLFGSSAEFVDIAGLLWTGPAQIAGATHAFDRLGNELITIGLNSHSILLGGDEYCVSRVRWEVHLRESGRRVGSVMMIAALENAGDTWNIAAAQNTRVED